MILMALCQLAIGEAALLVALRAMGVPDTITFTLFGMLTITLAYWVDSVLKTKGLPWIGRRQNRYQKFALVALSFAITIIAYWSLNLL